MVEWNGTRVLDLCAGTGAFGLECLSRGAQSLTCVEMQSLHVKFINDNFRLFEMEEASAIKLDVFKFLLQPGQKFDLIFADPPYDLPGIQSIPEKILNSGALEESGILIVEHGKRINFSEMPQFTQMRSFSNVCFSFFELKK
jgi:16S rRNA (guanine966-N2)-methyltransferase